MKFKSSSKSNLLFSRIIEHLLEMSKPISETLKINDELTIEIVVLYKHGEKYASAVNPEEVRINDIDICRLQVHQRRKQDLYYSYYTDFLERLFINSLSQQINAGERAYPYIRSFDSWWKLWNTEKWKSKLHQVSDPLLVENEHGFFYLDHKYLESNNDILFPFYEEKNHKWIENNCNYSKRYDYIHFDVFIFLLYLKYPQFKNDLIRFLKYQPICTLPSEELYIHTLKQANKELLKQLDSANEELSIRSKMKATEVEEMKANYEKEIDDLTKENETLNFTSKQLTETINELNSKNEALNSQLASANNLNNENNDLITSLRLQLEDKTNENNDLKNQLYDYKSKYETLKQKLSSLIE